MPSVNAVIGRFFPLYMLVIGSICGVALYVEFSCSNNDRAGHNAESMRLLRGVHTAEQTGAVPATNLFAIQFSIHHHKGVLPAMLQTLK